MRRASPEIEHIALGEGDWVDLRVLNFGDRQAITGAMADIETGNISASRLEAGNTMMLQRAIVAWGGPGFGCTCSGGCRCEPGKPPHANDCHVWAITEKEVSTLDETGDVLLRLVSAKQDKARLGGDPFVLPRPSSPTSGVEGEPPKRARTSRHTSTSGTSSASSTSSPERRSVG